ncbi:MAG: hypothetical protein HYV09_40240 [Deltaproteobacteria bacterium]|nr:hypothetical protein [Deltaproteobacteria bacterium]
MSSTLVAGQLGEGVSHRGWQVYVASRCHHQRRSPRDDSGGRVNRGFGDATGS